MTADIIAAAFVLMFSLVFIIKLPGMEFPNLAESAHPQQLRLIITIGRIGAAAAALIIISNLLTD